MTGVRIYGARAEEVMRAVRPFLGQRRGAKVDEALATRAAQLAPRPAECAHCGAVFLRLPSGRGLGRPRIYHSDACRSAARSERRRAA